MRKNGKNRLLAKKRIIALAALLCAGLLFGCKGNSPETPSEPVPEEITVEGQKFVLTFHDEFDGKKLDREKWNYCPMWERGNIGGFWDGNCVKLDGGHLVLTALLDGDGVPHSGAIRSKGLFEQAKGYFTARCKLQKAHGLWSAFWLMCDGAKNVGHGAIDGAEIDVFESYNIDRGAINHAIHYDGYDADHQSWVT